MRYSDVVIAICDKCTAECACCCFESCPDKNNLIDEDIVMKLIDSSKNVSNLSCFHFSGGEVFLYYEYLKRLIMRCKVIGKNTSIITNAYWANDYDSTVEKLVELKNLGLGSIGVSYDEYHQTYIPLSNIINYIRASRKVGFRPTIQAVFDKDSNNGTWINELGDNLTDVIINFMPCDNVGRAYKKIDKEKFLFHSLDEDRKLCRKGGTFSINFDGTIWPCCSPRVFSSDLSLGNIYREDITISEILSRLENNIYLKKLRRYGFEYYIDICRKYNIVDIPKEIISACDICNHIFNKSIQERLLYYIQ